MCNFEQCLIFIDVTSILYYKNGVNVSKRLSEFNIPVKLVFSKIDITQNKIDEMLEKL